MTLAVVRRRGGAASTVARAATPRRSTATDGTSSFSGSLLRRTLSPERPEEPVADCSAELRSGMGTATAGTSASSGFLLRRSLSPERPVDGRSTEPRSGDVAATQHAAAASGAVSSASEGSERTNRMPGIASFAD